MFQLSLVGVLLVMFGNCMTDSLLSHLGVLSISRLFFHVYRSRGTVMMVNRPLQLLGVSISAGQIPLLSCPI
jgi:hypothetical protein